MTKKSLLLGAAAGAGAFLLALAPSDTRAQAAATADDPALTPLLAELARQQTQIADNQTKIDDALAAVAEDLRVARIFAGRGGGKAK